MRVRKREAGAGRAAYKAWKGEMVAALTHVPAILPGRHDWVLKLLRRPQPMPLPEVRGPALAIVGDTSEEKLQGAGGHLPHCQALRLGLARWPPSCSLGLPGPGALDTHFSGLWHCSPSFGGLVAGKDPTPGAELKGARGGRSLGRGPSLGYWWP